MHRPILSLALFASLLPAQGMVVRRRVAVAAGGTVSWVNTNTPSSWSNGNVGVSSNVTITATGTNRAAFVWIERDNGTVTYSAGPMLGGSAMTKQCGTDVAGNGTSAVGSLWVLVNPPTGTQALTFTTS